MTQTVLCFDRDQTIDVNPPPNEEVVPLSWVQYFAHKTNDCIDVWATGNRQLQIEAGIPTPYEAKQMLINKGYNITSSISLRRGGLDTIEILYSNIYSDIQFIVVDDENLNTYSNKELWVWYRPNEFYRDIESISENLDIPDPRSNNMSGESYYDTTKYGTYEDLMDRLKNNLN